MNEHRGKIILLVNIPSEGHFSLKQIEGLEKLYSFFTDPTTSSTSNFTILAFPCDQFGKKPEQESVNTDGVAADEKQNNQNNQNGQNNQNNQTSALANQGVTFPVLGKIDVNGPEVDPLWDWLKKQRMGWFGRRTWWNFEKYLVNSEGRVVQRWFPTSKPERIRRVVELEMENAKARDVKREREASIGGIGVNGTGLVVPTIEINKHEDTEDGNINKVGT